MKTAKKKLNARLLRKIQAHILEEPKRFLMRTFVEMGSPGDLFLGDGLKPQAFPKCGTAACIGGWACILGGKPDPRNGDYESAAAKLLGISYSTSISRNTQSDRLFFVGRWPEELKSLYRKAHTPSARAKIAAARIDHFIATKGAE